MLQWREQERESRTGMGRYNEDIKYSARMTRERPYSPYPELRGKSKCVTLLL